MNFLSPGPLSKVYVLPSFSRPPLLIVVEIANDWEGSIKYSNPVLINKFGPPEFDSLSWSNEFLNAGKSIVRRLFPEEILFLSFIPRLIKELNAVVR